MCTRQDWRQSAQLLFPHCEQVRLLHWPLQLHQQYVGAFFKKLSILLNLDGHHHHHCYHHIHYLFCLALSTDCATHASHLQMKCRGGESYGQESSTDILIPSLSHLMCCSEQMCQALGCIFAGIVYGLWFITSAFSYPSHQAPDSILCSRIVRHNDTGLLPICMGVISL